MQLLLKSGPLYPEGQVYVPELGVQINPEPDPPVAVALLGQVKLVEIG